MCRTNRSAASSGVIMNGMDTARAENEQAEYYLTDTVEMAFREGLRVEGLVVDDFHEVSGINTRDQLDEAERMLERRG